MKNVKLKKVPEEQLKAKVLVLKSTGLFNEKELEALEKIIKFNLGAISLNDEQTEVLQSLGLPENIEEVEDIAEGSTTLVKEGKSVAKQNLSHTEPKTQAQAQDVKAKEASTQEKDNIPDEELTNERQSDALKPDEVDANIEIKADEKNKKEPDKEFMPKSPEELENMSPEEIGKMYYLTPDRMIESIKSLNGGKLWDNLAHLGNQAELQVAIERAYRSCVWSGDLMDFEFLDKRIGQYLPEGNQAIELKDMHKAALFNTYVGYHIEKNENDVKDLNYNGAENTRAVVVKFPTLVSDMPEEFKKDTRKQLVRTITNSIEDTMHMANSYQALIILTPIDNTIEEVIDKYSERLPDTDENKAVRAYIKTIRQDVGKEMRCSFDDLNVSLDLYGINWNNPEDRKSTIEMIEKLQGQGRDVDVSKLVEEINMSFTVNSEADLALVEAACADLADLSDQGVHVNIAFELPPREALNAELHEDLDNIVDQYENISRDTSTEAVNNGVDLMITAGIDYAIGTTILQEQSKDDEQDPKLNSVLAMAAGATEIAEIIEQTLDQNIAHGLPPVGGA